MLSLSASSGAYLLRDAPLPPGRGRGDYRQIVIGQDIGFARHHLQVWTEVYAARFEVPGVGDADTLAQRVPFPCLWRVAGPRVRIPQGSEMRHRSPGVTQSYEGRHAFKRPCRGTIACSRGNRTPAVASARHAAERGLRVTSSGSRSSPG